MALLYVDSFPYETLPARWTDIKAPGAYGGTLEVLNSNGRFGGRWLHIQGGGDWTYGGLIWVGKTLPANCPTLCCQFGFKPMTTTPNNFFKVRDSGDTQVYLKIDSGIISVYNGADELLGTAPSYVLSTNVWHQIEFKVTISHSAGAVTLRVDGVILLALSSIDTQFTANAYSNEFFFWADYGGRELGISDVIIMDTTGSYCKDLLGPRMVELKVADANGYYTQFTPSASPGNNADMVNEVPPDDDATYNTGDIDAIDTFTKTPILNPTATIDAVVCNIYCKTNDGGTATIAGVVRSDGVDALGPEIPVTASYDYLPSIIYLDPKTAAQFTAAGFNAAEFGYKRTA
jgi:hypothetical protein